MEGLHAEGSVKVMQNIWHTGCLDTRQAHRYRLGCVLQLGRVPDTCLHLLPCARRPTVFGRSLFWGQRRNQDVASNAVLVWPCGMARRPRPPATRGRNVAARSLSTASTKAQGCHPSHSRWLCGRDGTLESCVRHFGKTGRKRRDAECKLHVHILRNQVHCRRESAVFAPTCGPTGSQKLGPNSPFSFASMPPALYTVR